MKVSHQPSAGEPGTEGSNEGGIEFLERTSIRTRIGCYEGVLILEKGSRLQCDRSRRPGNVTVEGGEVILRGGLRLVLLTEPVSRIRIQKEPGAVFPMSLLVQIPSDAEQGRPLTVYVSQRDERGTTVGGASAIYIK